MTISQEEPEQVKIKKKRYLPGIDDEHWNSFNAVRKKYALSWSQVFDRFQIYQNGIEYIFSAPGEMSKQLRLDLNTIMGLMSQWLTNIKDNWYLIDKNPDISELKDAYSTETRIETGKKALLIAAGPSLEDKNYPQVLHEVNLKDTVIFSTLHSLKWCLENGIVPQFTGVVDASDLMVEFINSPLVDEHADEITMICCASTHPEVFKRWKGKKIFFFRSGIPQNILPNTDTFLSILLPKLTEMETGGNSGSSMYSIATYLGCNPIGMIGFDFGYPKEFPYDQTKYYHAYSSSIDTKYKDVQAMISDCYTDFHHPVFKKDAYYDFVYEVFRNSLFEMVKYNKKLNPEHRLINCTGHGTIYTEDGSIECMTLEEFLSERIVEPIIHLNKIYGCGTPDRGK